MGLFSDDPKALNASQEIGRLHCNGGKIVHVIQGGKVETIGAARPYTTAEFSPDGDYLLVEYLVGPWSHEVAYWRFAHEIEVWDADGNRVR